MPVHLWGGLKTETGKFLLHFQNSKSVYRGGLKNAGPFMGGGGLKTETGKFLLHFQNSKSTNRCRSVCGTDIITNPLVK